MVAFESGLAFEEFDSEAISSILLIHGGFATGREWQGVIKHITGYHVLVPDLPGHGRSQVNGLHFDLHSCVEQMAVLVRKQAKGGKARIVGLSLGSHVAVHLISKHPDIVDRDAMLSGYTTYPSLAPVASVTLGSFFYPASKIAYTFFSGSNKDASEFSNCSWQLTSEIGKVITTEDWPEPWPARTMIVSAAWGYKPIADRNDHAKELETIGRKLCLETIAFKNTSIKHPWHKENPKLFADTMLAWFHHDDIPEGFIKL